MAKPHLISSELPIRSWGGEMQGLCGMFVSNSEFVFFWDEVAVGSIWNTDIPQETCNACREQIMAQPANATSYVYAIVDGSKIKRKNYDRSETTV